MALRLLRASSSNLTRHSQRLLSTSSPRYISDDNTPPTAPADIDGPPTSVLYARSNPTANQNANSNSNPLRLNLSQHAIVQNYRIHVSCSPNNTHIVMSDDLGRPLKAGSWSGGACGFKGVNRSGYEAGYQCAVRAFARVKELARESGGAGAGGPRFEVLFKGFGQGREAVFKALMTSEGDDVRPFVTRVTDNTPIKIGGTRAKKTRRL
jgi:small subunit ribosomal protein S11